MISGVVTANGEAIIHLEILDPNGGREEIEAILDTGFNGSLTLPGHLVDGFHLPEAGGQNVILAEGCEVLMACTSPELSGTKAASTKPSY